jgi:hypothetical protein
MPRSILDMTADEDLRALEATTPVTSLTGNNKKPLTEDVNPGDVPMGTGIKPNPTVLGTDPNPGGGAGTAVEGEPLGAPSVGPGMAMSISGGANSAAASLPTSNASFNSGSVVDSANTPIMQQAQVPSVSSAKSDSTGNPTRDASGNTLGSSYETPEGFARMQAGKLGQTAAANLSTNPNAELNYGAQGASLDVSAQSGSVTNPGAIPQAPIDSLGDTDLTPNRTVEAMKSAEQPYQNNALTNTLPGTNAPADAGETGDPTNTLTGNNKKPLMQDPADWRGRQILGVSGATRQVSATGQILDGQGNPIGDGQGNLLSVGSDGTVMAGQKPWGYIQADGQVRQGLRPAAGVADPRMGQGMDFRGRSIIGVSGVARQVDQQGRILSEAGGGYQLAEDGSQLIVGQDGTITAGGKQWGYVDASGQVTKGRPNMGALDGGDQTGGNQGGAQGGGNQGGQASGGSPIAAQAGLISPEMLVENRIANMMRSGNPLLEQALTRAKQIANERGTLNSSMTAQAGTEAMLNASREIASQDANTLKDAALTKYQAEVQMIMQDKSLSAQQRENELNRAFQQRENALQRAADIEARQADRNFQRDENNTQRTFQRDMTQRGWQFDNDRDERNYQRNLTQFDRQIANSRDENDRNFFRTMQINYNESIMRIQTDPNMDPATRAAQINSINSIYSGMTYNGQFLNLVRPAASTTTGTESGDSGASSGASSGTNSR